MLEDFEGQVVSQVPNNKNRRMTDDGTIWDNISMQQNVVMNRSDHYP